LVILARTRLPSRLIGDFWLLPLFPLSARLCESWLPRGSIELLFFVHLLVFCLYDRRGFRSIDLCFHRWVSCPPDQMACCSVGSWFIPFDCRLWGLCEYQFQLLLDGLCVIFQTLIGLLARFLPNRAVSLSRATGNILHSHDD
jgi:hypothetical protein